MAPARKETLQIRVSLKEKQAIKQAAADTGKDVSAYVRDLAIVNHPNTRRQGK